VQASLLFHKNVDILDRIHGKQAFAGAKLRHIKTATINNFISFCQQQNTTAN